MRLIVVFGSWWSDASNAQLEWHWPSLLAVELDRYPGEYRVITRARAGDTVGSALERCPAVAAERPQLIFLEFGWNEVVAAERGQRDAALRDFDAGYRRLALNLRSACAKRDAAQAIIVPVTLPRPARDRSEQRSERRLALNEAVRRIGREINAPVADLEYYDRSARPVERSDPGPALAALVTHLI